MRIKPSQYPENQQEFFALKNKLRNEKHLIHKPAVQKWLKLANDTWDIKYYNLAMFQLNLLLKFHNEQEMCTPDEFRPYCPESLSRTGLLHIVDQMDGLPIFIDHNKLVTGLGIIGPQGSGKSFEIIDLCYKNRQIDPTIKITIIDPKGGFSNLASFLHIDLREASFDLISSENTSLEVLVYDLMPILADTVGLIYSLDLLNQAADIALAQRQCYINQTGIDPGLSLRDILEALKTIKVSTFRKGGYYDAVTTALSLMLGRQNLFSCRKGISLEWLFGHNVVLNAQCLTHTMQCQFFAVYLLFWLYQRARFARSTNQLKHLIIIDDATRFIGKTEGQFDGNRRTSPLGHILAVLRESGVCLAYATQLPAQIDPAVLSLTRNVLVIGNINSEDNLKVIQGIASLTDEQRTAIPRFKTRQTLAFISGLNWAYPIHGWTPNVDVSNYMTDNPQKPALNIIPWHSLTDIPQQAQSVQSSSGDDPPATEPAANERHAPQALQSVDKLVLHCINNPFVKAGDHADNMASHREYDAVKTQAVQEGLLLQSSCGKSLYLIPTKLAYEKFAAEFPYERTVSIEHSFYVQLTGHILKKYTALMVRTETPVGTKGAAIDVTTTDKSGNMTAIEVTLSTSNLSSNASKLQDTAYKKIVWLCRDADTVKAVKAYFNKSTTLPLELTSKFVCVHFSKWISHVKNRKGK